MVEIVGKIKTFFSYLWSKKTELSDMDEKDALLAKVVMDIHRKRSHSSFEVVPLYSISPIHPINRDSAIKATEERAATLKEHKDILLKQENLTQDVLHVYIPSVSAIKVVEVEQNQYVAYEGNGRLAALQAVFTEDENISLEVELYHFRNPSKIVDRINRVRTLHKLI